MGRYWGSSGRILGWSLHFTGCQLAFIWASSGNPSLQSGANLMGQFWQFCWGDCRPMLAVLVGRRHRESGQLQARSAVFVGAMVALQLQFFSSFSATRPVYMGRFWGIIQSRFGKNLKTVHGLSYFFWPAGLGPLWGQTILAALRCNLYNHM